MNFVAGLIIGALLASIGWIGLARYALDLRRREEDVRDAMKEG